MRWTLIPQLLKWVLATAALGLSTSLLANPVSTPHVQAELGSVVASIEPGSSFWVVLHLRMQEGWHTYWHNPGDAGLATAIDWVLPEGFDAGELVWPYPQRIPVGPLMNYGYEGDVSLWTQITAPETLVPGQGLMLRAETTWVVCATICVPEAATLELRLPVLAEKAQEDARWMAMWAQVQPTLPQPASWQSVFSGTQDTFTLWLAAPHVAVTRLAEVTFFPLAYGIIDHAAPQQISVSDQGLRLTVRRGPLDSAGLAHVDGVLVLKELRRGEPHVKAFTIRAVPAQAP
ncbi:protein-disulfide reductase DsbD domain-containing protein [Candidatus Entotheonella palauensis]|uniref:protein-disulfide reductase DsbD domain-containing protein n=1 Tax=Candidatus Entotheonella palauensis TaxID=93172 RepID=UPI0015C49114|nr:protein-disulfide reductase DsbD domain-containing protein [Candidatus Entotheonella palauensis]